MTSNAIRIYLDDIEITIDNWYMWMKYLISTEDKSVESINLVQPIDLLNKIEKVIELLPKNTNSNDLKGYYND